MSYRIEYDPQTDRNRHNSLFFRGVVTAICFVCFAWSVYRFWPEGRELLKLLILPGNPDVTLEAAEVFARELQTGESLSGAAERFVHAVFSHGTAN